MFAAIQLLAYIEINCNYKKKFGTNACQVRGVEKASKFNACQAKMLC